MAVKVSEATGKKTWLDWVITLAIVVVVAVARPFGTFGNMLLTMFLVAMYWVSVRLILVRQLPGLYQEYSCSGCSARVQAGAPSCPECGSHFDEPVGPESYRRNVVLILWALVPCLMIVFMIVKPDHWFEACVNILMAYVISVIVVFFDAERIGAGRSGIGIGRVSRRWWAFLMIVLWPLAFPLYLFTRKKIASSVVSGESYAPEHIPGSDMICSLLIPVAAPAIGILLAMYYAYWKKYLVCAAIILISLAMFAFSAILPSDYFYFMNS